MRGGFGSGVIWVHRILPVRHDAVIDAILDVRRGIGGAEKAGVVRLVFGEQQQGISLALEEIIAECRV
jgi:hypothetical protein